MSNKHKHFDLIVAQAANTSLIKYVKLLDNWAATTTDEWNFASEYFLCLPQHKEACLHWLNGGEVQYSLNNIDWFDKDSHGINSERMDIEYFNSPTHSMRIKPKKEKRWLGVYGNHVTDGMYPTKELCQRCVSRSDKFKHCAIEGWQFIEIEVEVKE